MSVTKTPTQANFDMRKGDMYETNHCVHRC